MRVRRILAAGPVSATLAVAPAAVAQEHSARPTVVSPKTCSAGFKHAVIDGDEKCLKRGTFCKHSADRHYRAMAFAARSTTLGSTA